MAFEVTDVALAVTVPFCVYWLTAIYYEALSATGWRWLDKYKLHSPAEEKRANLVSKYSVVLTVLAEHVLQVTLGLLLLDAPSDFSDRTLWGEALRLLGAMYCLDAWQFAFHRLMHEVDWLYKHIHSWHHRIYVPHAYAALFQHPVEMLIMDTLSGTVAAAAVGLAPRTAMIFWSISYFKTVSDHSNFRFPVNPVNISGWNNADYHDVHHSPTGLHLNYSQPYFTFWDRLYGCFKDPNDGVPLPSKKQL